MGESGQVNRGLAAQTMADSGRREQKATRRGKTIQTAQLNKLGLVNSYNGRIDYRIGVGLSIDWPKVQNSILYFNNLVG